MLLGAVGNRAPLVLHHGDVLQREGLDPGVGEVLLGQAVDVGVTRVRTDNDEENAPMLHINEQLGYERIPGVLSFLKRL